MVLLLKGLAREKVVLITSSQAAKLPFGLGGIVRLVNEKGRTLGLVLDQETIEELEEEVEASNPGFLASLEESRRSGRVPGKEVKKKIGFK